MKSKWSKERISKIREVLFNDWDPLCVNYNKNLSDEYDVYLGKIYEQLYKAHQRQELIEVLLKIETEDMGLEPDLAKLEIVAEKLLLLKDLNGEKTLSW